MEIESKYQQYLSTGVADYLSTIVQLGDQLYSLKFQPQLNAATLVSCSGGPEVSLLRRLSGVP